MADLAAMKRIDPKKAAANAFYKWRHKARKNRGTNFRFITRKFDYDSET